MGKGCLLGRVAGRNRWTRRSPPGRPSPSSSGAIMARPSCNKNNQYEYVFRYLFLAVSA
jgi:hypothetical protein